MSAVVNQHLPTSELLSNNILSSERVQEDPRIPQFCASEDISSSDLQDISKKRAISLTRTRYGNIVFCDAKTVGGPSNKQWKTRRGVSQRFRVQKDNSQ
mmetsp:Transcript_24278/g.37448  ORF Transcript_24278/g.37448 Transcript_24278/m.37448 type:complete len:99 (+) Transcript_24278:3254-3550(+)